MRPVCGRKMGAERIYVVGHRNPDSDSICSAIGYAQLRRMQGLTQVVAARAGNINRQTEFALEYFAVPQPELLTDVVPRVGDLVRRPAVTIAQDAPLAWAVDLFHQHDIGLLPVLDAKGTPLGLLLLKEVAKRFLVAGQNEGLRQVRTTVDSLIKALQAQVLHAVHPDKVENLDLYVGAMEFASFRERLTGTDPRRLLVVTGDRREIQEYAIQLGARMLVVTGGKPVAEELLAEARDKDVTVLGTSFDTATATWLARLSTPVSELLEPEWASVGINEPLDELRFKLLESGLPGVVVLDGDGRVVAVGTKSTLLAPCPIRLILVDHNELSQAVPGAERVEVLEVVDHHRLGNFHTDLPIRFINQPVGSTCTIVASLYQQAGLVPDRPIAGLLLSGLLSDTVILKSPTTTDLDRQLAIWLADLAGVDAMELGEKLFAAGSELSAYATSEELILADFKEYRIGNRLFGVGQVEVINFVEFDARKENIAASLKNLVEARGIDLGALLVTDIVRETSLLLVAGARELTRRIGFPMQENNLFELKGVLSRKKQLLPHLLRAFKE